MTRDSHDFDYIHRYTRAQAIADGVLIDLMQHPTPEQPELDDLRALVQEAGFRIPVAMTATAFAEAVAPLDGAPLPEGQDLTGRLWDVLWMLRCAIGRAGDTERVDFAVHVFDGKRHRLVELKALCGPGDHGEPVITILRPDED